MSVDWKNVLLWILPCVAFLLALEYALRPNTEERNYEIFTEMAYSMANESMSASVGLPGGMTQQPIVNGVVVRGQLPFRYAPGPEEAQRAGRELTNPHGDKAQDDPEVLARGAELYKRFCTVCHGAGGDGQGPVVFRGMLPPPSLHAARAVQMKDGEMFHILTLGQGNMASYAAQLGVEDRWKVIRHVRRLQEASQ
jgi:mono/diheme cytochrome c family protein